MKTRRYLSLAALALSLTAGMSAAQAQEGVVKVTSPIAFKGVGRLVTLKSKTKNWTVTTIYPHYNDKTRLVALVNNKLESQARSGFNEFLNQTRKDLREPNFTSPAPYEYQDTPALYFYRPTRLISTTTDTYAYTGGAHGNGGTFARNFGQLTGMSAPRELKLADFFKAGTKYQPLVQKLIFAKLMANKKNQEPTWLIDGTVKSLTKQQFDNFVIAPKGLTWFFNSYEIGPYAYGQYVVTLSPKELGPNFRAGEIR